MRKIVFIISFCFLLLSTLHAQTVADSSTSSSAQYNLLLSNRAFGLSYGKENHHVSYLSPLLYSGKSLEFWCETTKRKKKKRGDFYSVINNRVHASSLEPTNESTQMNSYYDVFDFHYYYDLMLSPKFHMLCGAYMGFEFGVDMLMSNTNNPVYVRANLDLIGLSLRPTLCIKAKRRLVKLYDQLDFRLAGMVFSPTYTQLYYDLTLPDYDKKEFLDFNSLSEKIRFANKLMMELPLRRTTLRLGMLAERSKSMINMIDNRTTNIQAIVGLSYDYFHLKGRVRRAQWQTLINNSPEIKTVFE